jgi:Bcr/CflA subfamily drug resistance transporter
MGENILYLSDREKFKTAVILCFLITVTLSSLDIYLPSIKSVANYFLTSKNYIQLSISLYLLGFAISQIFYGVLSDYCGRKKILLVGLLIGLIGNALCIFSETLTLFIIFRFITGMGDSVVWVLQRSMSRDIYTNKKLIVFTSFIAFTWALTLSISPMLGGYIDFFLGWKFNFIFITLYHVIAIIVTLIYLSETVMVQQFPFRRIPYLIFEHFKIFKNIKFVFYILITSISFAGFMGYNALSPFIFMSNFKLTPISYGNLGIYISIIYLITTGLNSILAKRYGIRKMLILGCSLMMLGGLLVTILAVLKLVIIPLIMGTIMVYIVGMGLTCPNATVGALTSLDNNFGIASSVYGSVQMLIGALVANFSVVLFSPGLIVLGGLFLLLTVLIIMFFLILDIYIFNYKGARRC